MNELPPPTLPTWLEPQVPFKRYRVQVGGYRMHVMEQGRGRPVLLLHGNPTWGYLYRKVASELAGEPLRLIMPDLIGLGFSDKPVDALAHQLDHHASWLGSLIDQLELEDLIFVGQDWGGPIGLRALADRPRRMTGLVILNTVIGPPRPEFKPTTFHRFARLPLVSDFVFGRLGFPEIGMHQVQGDRKSISGEIKRAYRYPLRKHADRVAPLALARMVPDGLDHPSVEPLGHCQELVLGFEGPIDVVWGKRDPVLGSVGRHLERQLPKARFTWTDAGHFLQEEVPGPIADAVRRVHTASS
ncbi:MAG: alpha/beta fold hydrolase [Myxococcales bacterium]|nr:alpha/beta fold hydrolase [Myxococcales bacterium]